MRLTMRYTEGVQRPPVQRLRVWPVSIRVEMRRCRAWTLRGGFCNGLLWPWQAVLREWEPDSYGPLVHHDCHHRQRKESWGDEWERWLNCEHRKS